MEKRIYGVLGISSIMANWNADFDTLKAATVAVIEENMQQRKE